MPRFFLVPRVVVPRCVLLAATIGCWRLLAGHVQPPNIIKNREKRFAEVGEIVMLDITYQTHQPRLPTGAAQDAQLVSFQPPAMQMGV